MSPLLSYAFSSGENNGHSRRNYKRDYNEVGEGDMSISPRYTEMFKQLLDTLCRTLTTFRVSFQRKELNKVL